MGLLPAPSVPAVTAFCRVVTFAPHPAGGFEGYCSGCGFTFRTLFGPQGWWWAEAHTAEGARLAAAAEAVAS